MGPSGPTARPWRNTSETLKQAHYFHGHSVRVAAADGVPPRPRLAGCTPEGGEGGDGCLGIGPLVRNLAKLGPRNRGARQSVPPVSAQGANQSPTSPPIASLMPEVQPAPGMRTRFLTTVLRESGRTSGALVVKAQEFAPLHHLARYTT